MSDPEYIGRIARSLSLIHISMCIRDRYWAVYVPSLLLPLPPQATRESASTAARAKVSSFFIGN